MKSKKILGKINIIDFIVVIAILTAGAVIAFSGLPNMQGSEQTLEVTFYAEEIPTQLASQIKDGIGGTLYDDTSKASLGKITAVNVVEESESQALKADGTYTISPKPGYNAIYITGEAAGIKTPNGAKISNQKYGVGHTFVLIADGTKYTVRVYDIKVKG